jgi:hypothetical protein
MSIRELREKDNSLRDLTMRYEDGGKVQVFKSGNREIKFGPMATDAEIIAAFKEQK